MKRDVSADRHDTWGGEAMDATRHETNDVVADGEVVWFWRSDAGAKVVNASTSHGRRWQPSMVTGKQLYF